MFLYNLNEVIYVKILAIDQSSTSSGIAIAEWLDWEDDWKLINHQTYKPKGKDFDGRMLDLCRYVDELIMSYRIDIVVMEDVYNLKNVSTLKKLANLQGALKQVCAFTNTHYEVITPAQWHKMLGCKNQRSLLKESSKNFVKDKFGLDDLSEDEYESICILTYYLERGGRNENS